MIEAALCAFEAPTYLIFSSNVPSLLYFSHFPAIFFALAFGLYVLIQGRGRLATRVLFVSLIPFTLWVIFDLFVFAWNRSDVVLFFWSLLVFVEPMAYLGLWYFLRVVGTGKDVAFDLKLLAFSTFLPLFVIAATSAGLPGFDVTYCIAVESTLLHYAYALEAFFISWILVDAVRFTRNSQDRTARMKIWYLTAGVILFLLAFSSGNVVGSITEDWNLAQAGLFGAPIFIGILAYSLVRFKLFNIKLLAAQMLVVVLWASVFSLLFLRTIDAVRIVTSLALILVLILGIILVRNVRKEVQAREEIARLAENLKVANERLTELDKLKSQFLSIASHDLRAPLTTIRNFMSLLLEKAFGPLPQAAEEGARQVFERATQMAKSVDNYLNVSRIEQGRMKYDFVKTDLVKIVKDTVDLFKTNAAQRGVSLNFSISNTLTEIPVTADIGKLQEVFNNLIDNSIKYTPKGSIIVSIEKGTSTAKVSIKDTGIGMPKEVIDKLFQLFSTAEDSRKTNITSTGVGLYIAKSHIDAHKGKVWAESEGKGKGSTFLVELPIAK